jgi:hypothetical protein
MASRFIFAQPIRTQLQLPLILVLAAVGGLPGSHLTLKRFMQLNLVMELQRSCKKSLKMNHGSKFCKRVLGQIQFQMKPGGEFLCYLYCKLEGKPFSYRLIFAVANVVRNLISRSPYPVKRTVSKLIAVFIYLPLARFSKLLHKAGRNVDNIPLHQYKDLPFYMLSNDALDRFGTRLEQRFNKEEIADMLSRAGFDMSTLKFSDAEPFWTFSVKKLVR